MSVYPVYDLFWEIGSVEVTFQSLYLHYTAKIKSNREGFVRLFFHKEGFTHNLGVFCLEQGDLLCSGRISLRRIQNQVGDGLFSIQSTPFFPLKTPLDGNFYPENSVEFQENGRQFVAICHEKRLPEGIMPFFCFLSPKVIDKTKCLVLQVDSDGKPVIPE